MIDAIAVVNYGPATVTLPRVVNEFTFIYRLRSSAWQQAQYANVFYHYKSHKDAVKDDWVKGFLPAPKVERHQCNFLLRQHDPMWFLAEERQKIHMVKSVLSLPLWQRVVAAIESQEWL